MSEFPDHDRVRQLLKRLEQHTRESESIRERIQTIKSHSPEWPDRRHRSRLFDDLATSGETDSSSR